VGKGDQSKVSVLGEQAMGVRQTAQLGVQRLRAAAVTHVNERDLRYRILDLGEPPSHIGEGRRAGGSSDQSIAAKMRLASACSSPPSIHYSPSFHGNCPLKRKDANG